MGRIGMDAGGCRAGRGLRTLPPGGIGPRGRIGKDQGGNLHNDGNRREAVLGAGEGVYRISQAERLRESEDWSRSVSRRRCAPHADPGAGRIIRADGIWRWEARDPTVWPRRAPSTPARRTGPGSRGIPPAVRRWRGPVDPELLDRNRHQQLIGFREIGVGGFRPETSSGKVAAFAVHHLEEPARHRAQGPQTTHLPVHDPQRFLDGSFDILDQATARREPPTVGLGELRQFEQGRFAARPGTGQDLLGFEYLRSRGLTVKIRECIMPCLHRGGGGFFHFVDQDPD